ncbi:MAG: hypothetical protein NTW16_06820 [Bacteroidetes bacterium]|nr:hypothetical protein [Bacteroidota bacterium]
MKKISLFIVLLLLSNGLLFSQVGISPDSSIPDASAGLDVNFNNKGLLPPRVALTAINSSSPITDPAVGLLVYNTAVAGVPPNNVMSGYYCWNGTKWIPALPPQGTNIGDMQYWNGTQWVNLPVGTNGQFLTLINGVPAWGPLTFSCGAALTINHMAGNVAPVTKTVTYNTANEIPGELTKCWITSNLGSDHQATAVSDDTEASAGWYWQFNRKQGYMHDGENRIPNTDWISTIDENAEWQPSSDPCTLELGAGWRIPTSAEWSNVDASENWTDWNGPWNSALKIHAAGYLYGSDGSLTGQGSNGTYWSSTQDANSNGWYLDFYYFGSNMYNNSKAFGFSIRCLKDS